MATPATQTNHNQHRLRGRPVWHPAIEGMGTKTDLQKLQDLENVLNESLGWTGLGHCDGNSIGSGTMEACCYVVDFEIAKRVLTNDLAHTRFSDYTRIYDEDS